MRQALQSKSGILLVLCFAACLLVFIFFVGQFFPNANEHLGHDYSLFLPWLLSGQYWQAVNGSFSPVPFTPSFCGGVPLLFNPQSIYYSLPQALALVVGPVTAFYLTTVLFGLIGCSGAFLLARRFRISTPASLVVAALFLLNGFFIFRMVIGHVTYHAVMLAPLLALLLLTDSALSWRRATARIAVAALIVAYFFYSGATNVILPSGLAVAMLWVLYRLRGDPAPNFVRDAALAALLGVALAAYKLVPALAFAENVTRPISLQLTDDLFRLLGGLGVGLFAPQLLPQLLPDDGRIWRHEMEYGVGLVPLIAFIAVAFVSLRNGDLRSWWGTLRARKALGWLIGLIVLLVLPILINYDAPGMRRVLLHIPFVKMMSLLVRFWFAYIPLLCILSGLVLDYLAYGEASRRVLGAFALALTVLQLLTTDTGYYARQGYDPHFIVEAFERLDAGQAAPAITWLGDPWQPQAPGSGRAFTGRRNDSLVVGITNLPCYEPMFGYHLESYPGRDLGPGPVTEISDGSLRLRNPACYVFPSANRCAPGDGFAPHQMSAAMAFSQYRPFPYAIPWWMTAAGLTTFIAAALTFGGLLLIAMIGLRKVRPR